MLHRGAQKSSRCSCRAATWSRRTSQTSYEWGVTETVTGKFADRPSALLTMTAMRVVITMVMTALGWCGELSIMVMRRAIMMTDSMRLMARL
eukprot:53957-Eustigmatos_ZCMA.PRE.1